MNTMVELTETGIKVTEKSPEVSEETWDWVFNIFTQANGASLTSGEGYTSVNTNDPTVTELLHDLAIDYVPDYWYVKK